MTTGRRKHWWKAFDVWGLSGRTSSWLSGIKLEVAEKLLAMKVYMATNWANKVRDLEVVL